MIGLRRGWAVAVGTAFAITGSAALAASTDAATPAAGAPPVSADPAMTSATYGDWILRCQRVADGSTTKRLCEVAQTVRLSQGRDAVAEVAFGHVNGEKALRVTALLPTNILLPGAVSIAGGDKPAPALDLQWRRCVPVGCLADAAATDEAVRTWRGQAAAGRLDYKDGVGHDVTLPLSFRGLAQALDALEKA